MKDKDINRFNHTRYRCQYYIAVAPKHRQKIFCGEHKAEIGKTLRELCEWKGIHMLVEILPKDSVAGFMGFLKGKSSILVHERHESLKYKYGNQSFWCRRYFVDTVGKNTKKLQSTSRISLKKMNCMIN